MKELVTKYSYYFEMANLCEELAKAYTKLDCEKSVEADIYNHARDGFRQKIKYLSIDESQRPLSEERYKRLEDFRWFVMNKINAAKRHKEKAHAQDTNSTGA